MALYEVLYGPKCRTPLHWDEDVISTKPKKSYADLKWRDLEFAVGDHVFLKVSPMKGVLRFSKKGKLCPRYIGPFEVLERIGTQAYWLALPLSLSGVHNVFHISMLRGYIPNPSHVIGHTTVQWTPDLSYEEVPKQILDRQVRKLSNKEVRMVKVLWGNQLEEEATWESELDMRNRYPEFFGKSNFEDEFFFRGENCKAPGA
ncbi:uncharacterized protein LOC122033929 [Zingiber officinale]|uniref:uncharacterized protein LOC122033929 n=1 Tax=Zingiber officinale TaxID=94328 RepID=UPI001C4B396F|nr:uncharacterized protein LOC122033929 [Zingiber officinale]